MLGGPHGSGEPGRRRDRRTAIPDLQNELL
jgi:hypothetical protein